MSIDILQNVVLEFVETVILPVASAPMQWVIRGAEVLFPGLIRSIIESKKDALKLLGLIDGEGNLNIENTKQFINGAFTKMPAVEAFGITFTKADGDKFIALLEKHKGV